MEFKFYKEPFDITKPPPAPPDKDVTIWPWTGAIETRDSKQRTEEYMLRLDEYMNAPAYTSVQFSEQPRVDLGKLSEVTAKLETEHKETILAELAKMRFEGIPVICSSTVKQLTILLPKKMYRELENGRYEFAPKVPVEKED